MHNGVILTNLHIGSKCSLIVFTVCILQQNQNQNIAYPQAVQFNYPGVFQSIRNGENALEFTHCSCGQFQVMISEQVIFFYFYERCFHCFECTYIFPFITLFKRECYGNKFFSTYLESSLFLTKKYTKPSICICFPPGKYISLKKYMYICTAKNYIILLIHLPMLNISKPYKKKNHN